MSEGRGRQCLGRLWEARAAEFLERHGIAIIARGYRCRLGELDLVGRDRGGLVIVEVRARRRESKGSALETVGRPKQQRIIRATRHFLMRHPAWHAKPIRFDVVAIDGIDTDAPEIRWVRNAFDAA
jgi:putative endonuclease